MIQQKFAAMRQDLESSLIERDQEIELVLTAMLAQEHCLFVGLPGTAKSMLCDALADWMDGKVFKHQLNKFTQPDELFGPVSLVGLKNEEYRRITTNKIVEADLVVIDEVFKASSAILNTLLMLMNERKYENGDKTINCPLKLMVGASNEYPHSQEGGKELAAMYDRFLFRKTLKPIATERGLRQLLQKHDHTPVLTTSLTPEELSKAHQEAMAIPVTNDAFEAIVDIVRELKNEGITPGDRRLCKSPKAAKAFAYLSGDSEVRPDHLEVLSHTLWDDPEEHPKKVAEVVGRIANPVGMKINSLQMEADEILAVTDPRDLVKASSATKKLQNIYKELEQLNGHGKAGIVKEYVAGEIKRIRLAAAEAL